MSTVQSSEVDQSTIELAPNYTIPLVLIGGSLLLLPFLPILSIVLSLFGLFLLIQTVTVRLQFTGTGLDVYRSGNLIRGFPYQDWQNWRIFWEPLPILFYFKEVKSIHFLPIIFDPKTLRACLEKHYPLNVG
ncbi:MAG: hypothetical protein N5P05_002806 [Chroococcopsis gigantea SAG 12.99]|jgi:hypothetical protein|nr:DUF3119 family protein [Chlorogloea purpurea SAG 13.99]MDV3001200.1 hypothetical protein [Chroococcopsis gigantea SAG 12.99]